VAEIDAAARGKQESPASARRATAYSGALDAELL
jgi:hypothetical protein